MPPVAGWLERDILLFFVLKVVHIIYLVRFSVPSNHRVFFRLGGFAGLKPSDIRYLQYLVAGLKYDFPAPGREMSGEGPLSPCSSPGLCPGTSQTGPVRSLLSRGVVPGFRPQLFNILIFWICLDNYSHRPFLNSIQCLYSSMYSIATLEIRYLSLVAAEDPKMAMFMEKQRINQGIFGVDLLATFLWDLCGAER